MSTGQVNEKPRILIVEDELMVSMLIEETLLEAGYFVVGPFANMTDAIRAAQVERLDAAVLDVNVAGQMIYPVAEELSARAIPFGFATGYGKAVSAKPWNDRPVLPKPFSGSELENLVAGLISKDAAK